MNERKILKELNRASHLTMTSGNPHRFAAIVEKAILELLTEISRFPLSHFSEKSLQVRLSAKLLSNKELSTPYSTNIKQRYQRNLSIILREENPAVRNLQAYFDRVYQVPPIQMEYGRGDKKRIDVAILDPDEIQKICCPLQFQGAKKSYIKPAIGVEFGTEKTGWRDMYSHLTKDGEKLLGCKHGYSVSVMRNSNFSRKNSKTAAAKNATIEQFRNAVLEHHKKYKTVNWIGIILHLSFGVAECFSKSGEWVRCDISEDLGILEKELRGVLTLVNNVKP